MKNFFFFLAVISVVVALNINYKQLDAASQQLLNYNILNTFSMRWLSRKRVLHDEDQHMGTQHFSKVLSKYTNTKNI